MPFASKKQRTAMYAASKGKSDKGIPKKVADEFIKDDKGGKASKAAKRYGKKG